MNVRVYLSHVFVLLFGNAAAQLINLASYPILTRLYGPGDFGGLALFLSVVGIVGPIACARFDLIVQSSEDWQLPAVFRQALRFNIWVSAATTVVAVTFALAWPALDLLVALLIGLAVFLTGYTLASLALIVRQEGYQLYARSMVMRSVATALAQIGLWYAFGGAIALIVGFCAGFAVQALVLKLALTGVRWRRSLTSHKQAVLSRYRPQITTDIPSTLIAGLVLNLMTFLMLELYSREAVGYYSLAFRVAMLPLSLISGSLSEVFFQKASAAFRSTGVFWQQLRFNILSSIALAFLVFVPLALAARRLFAVAFGSEWLPAADMLIVLTPMLVARFVSATVQTAPLVIGRVRLLLFQHLGLLAAILGAYATAKLLDLEVRDYLLLTSVSMAFVYTGYLVSISAIVWVRFRAYPGLSLFALRNRK